MTRRCLSRATLETITSDQRRWDGIPHVTNLLNGTIYEYLKIKHDYAESPDNRAALLLGIAMHSQVALPDTPERLVEVPLNIGWIQGKCDLMEWEPEGWVMTDYKTYGAYRVELMLRGDILSEQYQMNMYRMMIKQQLGLDIARMQVQATVKDGKSGRRTLDKTAGLVGAGVRNIYMIDIPRMSDPAVELYFRGKAEALHQALAGNIPPAICNTDENWGLTRCKYYCPVWDKCELGRKVHE